MVVHTSFLSPGYTHQWQNVTQDFGDDIKDFWNVPSDDHIQMQTIAPDVEKVKTQIFLNLFSIANGKQQKNLENELIMADLIESPDKEENSINTPLPNSLKGSNSLLSGKSDLKLSSMDGILKEVDQMKDTPSVSDYSRSNLSIRYAPLKGTDNFFDYRTDIPNGVSGVITDIFSVASELFLGSHSRGGQKDQLKFQQLTKMLKESEDLWNGTIEKDGNSVSVKGWHEKPFQNQMDKVIAQAKELLINRKKDQAWTDSLRLTFFATIIIAALGKLIGSSRGVLVGLYASSITLLFMGIHYGVSTFKQTQSADDLKNRLESVYLTASR